MMEGSEVPKNEDPEIVRAVFSTVIGMIQLYGWYIILVVAALMYGASKLRPQLAKWSEQREASSHKKLDSGAAQSRLEAMERARQRMQEKLDAQAVEFAEKQKQREEEKRRERIEDWDRHQEGKGYRSKHKAPEERPTQYQKKPKDNKKPLKPEYNPLMGDMGGACYRPTRRGGASGGG